MFFGGPKFKFEFLTDKGKRENNEDVYAAEKLGPGSYFLAVADGMGGKAGGELASRIVITSILEYLKSEFTKSGSKQTLKGHLEKAFLVAQTAVSDKVTAVPALKGMGTTLTAVLIKDGKYVWGNIGDSRIYLMSYGQMSLITEDHSYIRDFIRNHNKELPMSILAQYKNIVTRVIDGGTDKPDIFPSKEDFALLKDGDLFLLCSDGLLNDKVNDQEIPFTDVIIKAKTLRRIARNLVDYALEKGSDDNVTVVLGLNGDLLVKPPAIDYKTIRIVKKTEE